MEGDMSEENGTAPVMAGEPLVWDTETFALMVGGRIIGEYNDGKIVLDAGWCRLAGVGLEVRGDPSADKRRVVFQRGKNDHRLASGA